MSQPALTLEKLMEALQSRRDAGAISVVAQTVKAIPEAKEMYEISTYDVLGIERPEDFNADSKVVVLKLRKVKQYKI